jgi:dihydropteroate synthase
LQDESIFPRGRVTVVGVLNATPDSFSDGGQLTGPDARTDVAAAVRAGELLMTGGAEILDVGGESTRPGAPDVPEAVELARVIPLIEALVAELSATVSIDTRKAGVARAAIAAGATIVNDVSGAKHDPRIADVVAATPGTSLILGHIRGTPADMQDAPHYDDVLLEVATELEASVAIARAAGIPDMNLAIDPGIGFGKGQADNLQLLAHAGWLGTRLGLPVLVGPSRKSFLGRITGDPVDQRETATHAACAVAAFTGADAVRVHDAAGARRAVLVGRALRDARRKELS